MLARIKKTKIRFISTGTVLSNHHSKCKESTNLLFFSDLGKNALLATLGSTS